MRNESKSNATNNFKATNNAPIPVGRYLDVKPTS